jgi:hypothetical protein
LEWHQKRQFIHGNQTSWYQSIDEKHLGVHVTFDGGLPILFTRKIESKKSETFSKVSGLSFFQMTGFEKSNLCSAKSANNHYQHRVQTITINAEFKSININVNSASLGGGGDNRSSSREGEQSEEWSLVV